MQAVGSILFGGTACIIYIWYYFSWYLCKMKGGNITPNLHSARICAWMLDSFILTQVFF